MIDALQVSIHNRLSSFTALTDLLATFDTGSQVIPAVYDQVPQVDDPAAQVDFPYVVLQDWTSQANDTDTETGFDLTLTIHTWSRQSGFFECQRIMEQVYNALHRHDDLTVPDWGVSGMQQEFSDMMRDPDGLTRHGVQRFRIFIEPTS